MFVIFFLISFLCGLQVAAQNFHAGCESPPPFERYLGETNNFPVLNGSSARVLLKKVPGGLLYRTILNADAADGAAPTSFYEAHVWGTPYEWGFALGELYGSTATTFLDAMWKYLQGQVESALGLLPPWLQKLIAEVGLEAALEATYVASKDFTDPTLYEELRGLAAALKYDFHTLLWVHMLPGLTQGACSMFGAWGDALAKESSVRLLQLRALDWDMNAPVRNYSAVTVYHPSDAQYGHPHVLVGLVGFAGALSGMSTTKLGISEIGVSYPDSSFGSESRIGDPFVFVLREILKYDRTLDDAENRLIAKRRTCNLILGVGDGKLDLFRSFEYSSSTLVGIDDLHPLPRNASWHAPLKSVVYHGMDWVCPSFSWMLYHQLSKHYGALDPVVAMKDISAVQKSGDNHIAIYDLTNLQMYVSFSAPLGASGKVAAYERQYVHLDVAALFAEQRPANP